jgi:hypothetical protein
MIYTLFILLIFCTGCQGLKTFAPTIGGGIGAGVGSLGGIPGSIAGGTLGAGAGQIYKEVSQNEKAQKTLEALSHGDVQALVSAQMSDHATGFDEFKDTILNMLKIAGSCLLAYLTIPLWVARKTATQCAKSEAEKHQTKAPFPVKPPKR